MAREPVFYSFHYDNDVFRVQQIRNMGVIEENEPVSPNVWEEVKKGGDAAIRKWIDDNMSRRRCVIVLIGSATAGRKWIDYEIEKAWRDKRGLFGVYIHNLRCPRQGIGTRGTNPFSSWNVGSRKMSDFVTCYEPPANDAYGYISQNIKGWVDTAIEGAKTR
jgi:antiphage defense system Thoeris ThsB-like protein